MNIVCIEKTIGRVFIMLILVQQDESKHNIFHKLCTIEKCIYILI